MEASFLRIFAKDSKRFCLTPRYISLLDRIELIVYPVVVIFFKKIVKKKIIVTSLLCLVALIVIGGFLVTSKFQQKKHTSPENVLSSATAVSPTISLLSPTITSSPTPTISLGHPVYIGMWTQGLWDDSSSILHPEKLLGVQNAIGKKVAIAHFYTGWHNLSKASTVTALQTIGVNGWRPMISINPSFSDNCSANGKTLYKAIADGNCDELLHAIGKRIKEYGNPLFLRFAWEMNIDSMQWSIQKTGSSPSDFIAAWRRFHDIVVSEGGTNALWVFAPNVNAYQSIAYNLLYPGDGYVDWTGLDGYNWGTTQSWTHWETFSSIFSSSYATITNLAPAKPLMIAEVNTTDVGGNKAAWYRDMLAIQIPNNFPKITAVVFYNEDRSAQEHVNWLFDSAADSLQAFSESIKRSMYLSSF